MRDTVAVVVTYNRKELLKECIDSLLSQKNAFCDILIIDNHSTDGTKESLQDYIENNSIMYCDTGKNLGGAGGFNEGIKRGTILGYKYLWIMDDDCIPTETALSNLKDADNQLNGEYGFLSSKAIWMDGSVCRMNIQRQTLTKNVSNYSETITDVVMASFVSLYIKSDIVKEMGLPIKEFFIWTDDWEYTRRISRNYDSYLVPSSVVVHKPVSNIPADISIDSISRIDRYRYRYRNDVYLFRREGFFGVLYLCTKVCYHILKIVLYSKDSRLQRICTVIEGSCRGVFFNPKIEYLGDQYENS